MGGTNIVITDDLDLPIVREEIKGPFVDAFNMRKEGEPIEAEWLRQKGHKWNGMISYKDAQEYFQHYLKRRMNNNA